jgi:hypothetical protein
MSDSAQDRTMELGYNEDKLVEFWVFQTWMGHYADAIREGREEAYRDFLRGVALQDVDASQRATAKAVYKWGPRLDIATMP